MNWIFWLLLSIFAPAHAQCSGVFPGQYVCGNPTNSPAPPGPFPTIQFSNSIFVPSVTTSGDIVTWGSATGSRLSDSGAKIFSANGYGADPTGSADSTSAINACLTAAGATGIGGTCLVANGRYKALGNITIPLGTTLSCGDSFYDAADVPANLNTYPAITLDTSHSILAGGANATIKNCLVLNNSISWPPASTSSYTGVALNDNGNTNFTVINNVIVGFDTCVWWQGARPFGNHIYADCNGVTHASIEVDTGNTDSGYLTKVKLQRIGQTNSLPCTNITRPGTGLRVGGSPVGAAGVFIDDIVSQDFQVYQYDFQNAVIGGNIWADNLVTCGFNSTVGINMASGVTAVFNSVNLNAQQNGLINRGNGAETYIGTIACATINQDCVTLGDGSASGTVTTGLLTGTANRYAVNVQHINLAFNAARVSFGTSANTLPVFNSNSNLILGQGIGANWYIGQSNIVGIGRNSPYSTSTSHFFWSGGGSSMVRGVGVAIGCGGGGCGLGSGGTATGLGVPDQASGVILLTTGTSPSSSGQITITGSLFALTFQSCIAQLGNGNTAWPTSSSVAVTDLAGNQTQYQWQTNNVSLANATTYSINYKCDAS